MADLHLCPRGNYHIYGKHAWDYAAWLAGQLPEAYVILTANDEFRAMLKDIYVGYCIPEPGEDFPKDRHKLLVLTHADPVQTMILHESVCDGDYVYTIQESETDVDIMEGVESVDADMELFQHIHFFGDGWEKLLKDLNDILLCKYDLTEGFHADNGRVYAYEVATEKEYLDMEKTYPELNFWTAGKVDVPAAKRSVQVVKGKVRKCIERA